MSLSISVAAKVVADLEWCMPTGEVPMPLGFGGQILISQNQWLVLIPALEFSSDQARRALEGWFTVLKSIKKGKPGRIDVVFCLEHAAPKDCHSLAKLKKQSFLGHGVFLGYVDTELSLKTLPQTCSKALKEAIRDGAQRHFQGHTVSEDDYLKLVEGHTEAFRSLQERLGQEQTTGSYAILGICFAMFLWAEFSGGTSDLFTLVRFGANYEPLTRHGEWWRLVGAMFMHIGWFHLFVNMYSLAAVGFLLERIYGTTKYLALYAFAGLLGSLASMQFGQGAVSAGASGALFGVFGATALVGYRYKDRFPGQFGRALSQGMWPAIGYNLVYGFSHEAIDNAAHVGGLVAGVLFAAVIVPDLIEERPRPLLRKLLMVLAALPFLVQLQVAYRAAHFDSMETIRPSS